MINPMTILTVCITLFVSLVLPVAALIVLSRRWKLSHIPSAWFLGAAGFFIPQMLIRLPILTKLSGNPGFLSFAQNHFVLYSIALAFTAGLFELAGRYGVAKLLRKDMTYRRAIAAGLGHGGIEAMVLIGTSYISNLVFLFMIANGSFDTLIAQTAANGVDVSSLYAAKEALLGTSPLLFLLAGYERILTMVCHCAMSLTVCWGVFRGKPGKSLLVCLLFHTLLDCTPIVTGFATPALGNVISQTTAYVFVYILLTLAAGIAVWMIRTIRSRWNAALQEAANDPEV